MEILKDKMLPRKYWKDPEIISNFNVTLYRLFFQSEELGVVEYSWLYNRSVQFEDKFHQYTRWPTKLFSWIGRKLNGFDIYF